MAMALSAMLAVGGMGISAMASGQTLAEMDPTPFDFSIYDDDMVYVPEHAQLVEEYFSNNNARLSATYREWNWASEGICSKTASNTAGYIVPYYFSPTNNSLYFYVDVLNARSEPFMTVNKYYSDGSVSYLGTYYITPVGGGTYRWENYRRQLNNSEDFMFSVFAYDGWTNMSIDIYNQPF